MNNITSFFITVQDDEADEWNFCVVAYEEHLERHVTSGFKTVSECWDYARMLAKCLNLPESSIDSDVHEEIKKPRILHRIK